MKDVFSAIEKLMHEHRLSKTDLANIAGVGPSAVTKWSQGGAIREHHLAAIATHFGVALGSLTTPAKSETHVREHPTSYGTARATPPQTSCRIPASCDISAEISDVQERLAKMEAQLETLTRLLGATLAANAQTHADGNQKKTA